MAHHGELVALLAKWMSPKVYVEIGVAQGLTMKKVEPHCGEAHGVDLPQGSDEFFATWPQGKTMDLVFIDGDHHAAQVKKDVENAKARLSEYGVIAIHDTFPPSEENLRVTSCGDACTILEELETEGWEMFTIPATYGVTLLRRRLMPKWAR